MNASHDIFDEHTFVDLGGIQIEKVTLWLVTWIETKLHWSTGTVKLDIGCWLKLY